MRLVPSLRGSGWWTDATVIPGTDKPLAGLELPHWSGVNELAACPGGVPPGAQHRMGHRHYRVNRC
jgi:hypothetical protein